MNLTRLVICIKLKDYRFKEKQRKIRDMILERYVVSKVIQTISCQSIVFKFVVRSIVELEDIGLEILLNIREINKLKNYNITRNRDILKLKRLYESYW